MDECLICGIPGCCASEHEIDAIENALDNPWLTPVDEGELEEALDTARSLNSIERFASRVDAL